MPAKSSFLASSLNRRSRSIARSVFSFSWVRQAPGSSARRKLSPRCPWAPSSMFCRTVRRDSALVSWKVRTTPRRATWCGDSLPSWRPSNDQVPVLGWSNPVSRLNSVVLPAPLGPIKPVMPPRSISRWSTETAVRPPKLRVTPSTTIAGSGLATPTSQGTDFRAAWASRRGPAAEAPCAPAGVAGSAGIEHHLSSVAEDALWPEDQQRHQTHPDQHEAQLRDVGRAEQALRDDPVANQGAEPGVGELDHEQQDRTTDHRAPGAGRATENQGGVGEERVGVLVLIRVHRPQTEGVDRAAERADDTAQHERLHLVGVDVLPQRAGGVLVLTDGLDHAPPRAAHEGPDEQGAQQDDDPAHQRQPQLRTAPAGAEDVVLPALPPRRQRDETGVEAGQPAGASGDRGGPDRPEHQPQDLGGRDGDDREVVGAQAQGRDAEQDRQDDGGGQAQEDADPEGQPPLDHAHRDAEGAHQAECRLPEVQQAGVAEVHVEPDGEQDEEDRLVTERGLQAPGDGVDEVRHGSAHPDPAAEDALRPDDEDDDQEQQPSDVLDVARDDQGRHLHEDSDDEAADEGAVGRAETAERDSGEHQQEQPEAHVPLDGVGQPQKDTAQGGQQATDGPDDQDDPVDVDPGRGGQVAVVRDGAHGLPDLRPLQHQRDQDEDDDRDDDRGQGAGRQGEEAVVDRALVLVADVGTRAAPEDDLDQVPQCQRQPDRDDQGGDESGASAAQWPPDRQVVEGADRSAHDQCQQCRPDQRDAGLDVQEPGRDRADGHQLAVREVGQPGGAEDEREADRAHRDEQAEPQPVDNQLDQPSPAAAPAAGRAVGEAEVDRLHTTGGDRHRPRVAAAAELDVVGKVAGVDRDGVLAGSGQVDRPLAAVVGLVLAHGRAAGVGDPYLDVLDGAAAAGRQGAHQLLALRLGDAGQQDREDHRERGHEQGQDDG